MKIINVGIVVDWIGSRGLTAEEEIEEIMDRLANWLEGAKLKLIAHSYSVYQSTREHIDLLVLDYGGVLPGADDMVLSQMRDAREWAENHPSGLALLYTDYTKRWYDREMEDDLVELNNVVYRHQEDHIFNDLIAHMRRWFGLEEPTPKGKLVTPRRRR